MGAEQSAAAAEAAAAEAAAGTASAKTGTPRQTASSVPTEAGSAPTDSASTESPPQRRTFEYKVAEGGPSPPKANAGSPKKPTSLRADADVFVPGALTAADPSKPPSPSKMRADANVFVPMSAAASVPTVGQIPLLPASGKVKNDSGVQGLLDALDSFNGSPKGKKKKKGSQPSSPAKSGKEAAAAAGAPGGYLCAMLPPKSNAMPDPRPAGAAAFGVVPGLPQPVPVPLVRPPVPGGYLEASVRAPAYPAVPLTANAAIPPVPYVFASMPSTDTSPKVLTDFLVANPGVQPLPGGQSSFGRQIQARQGASTGENSAALAAFLAANPTFQQKRPAGAASAADQTAASAEVSGTDAQPQKLETVANPASPASTTATESQKPDAGAAGPSAAEKEAAKPGARGVMPLSPKFAMLPESEVLKKLIGVPTAAASSAPAPVAVPKDQKPAPAKPVVLQSPKKEKAATQAPAVSKAPAASKALAPAAPVAVAWKPKTDDKSLSPKAGDAKPASPKKEARPQAATKQTGEKSQGGGIMSLLESAFSKYESGAAPAAAPQAEKAAAKKAAAAKAAEEKAAAEAAKKAAAAHAAASSASAAAAAASAPRGSPGARGEHEYSVAELLRYRPGPKAAWTPTLRLAELPVYRVVAAKADGALHDGAEGRGTPPGPSKPARRAEKKPAEQPKPADKAAPPSPKGGGAAPNGPARKGEGRGAAAAQPSAQKKPSEKASSQTWKPAASSWKPKETVWKPKPA